MHLHFEESCSSQLRCDSVINSLSWMGRVPDEQPEVIYSLNISFRSPFTACCNLINSAARRKSILNKSNKKKKTEEEQVYAWWGSKKKDEMFVEFVELRLIRVSFWAFYQRGYCILFLFLFSLFSWNNKKKRGRSLRKTESGIEEAIAKRRRKRGWRGWKGEGEGRGWRRTRTSRTNERPDQYLSVTRPSFRTVWSVFSVRSSFLFTWTAYERVSYVPSWRPISLFPSIICRGTILSRSLLYFFYCYWSRKQIRLYS